MASLHIAGSGDGDGDFEALVLEEVDCQLLLADAEALLESVDGNEAPARAERAEREKSQAKLRRHVYRKKLKEERQSLYEEGEELTEKLRALQAAKEDARRREEEAGEGGKVALSAWRAVAMRQLGGRTEAEVEQYWLREQVNDHARMIRDLERVIRKRIDRVDAGCGSEVGSAKRARLGEKDAMLYNAYLAELDELYVQTDEVFLGVGSVPIPGGFVGAGPVKKKHGDTEYFEAIDVVRIPFNFQQTCDAVWEMARSSHRQIDRQEYDGVPDAENTVAYSYSVPYRREGGNVVTIKTQFVSRRYFTSSSRLVLTWRAFSEADGDLAGMHSVETGWCLVEPLEEETSTCGGVNGSVDPPMTLLKNCDRFVPMNFGTSTTRGPSRYKADQFQQLMLELGKEEMQEVVNMLGRLQLDDKHSADSPNGCEPLE